MPELAAPQVVGHEQKGCCPEQVSCLIGSKKYRLLNGTESNGMKSGLIGSSNTNPFPTGGTHFQLTRFGFPYS
ncbi:hypothetical protein [Rosistilla oblonga]|uniref:hypothetical protein n=1 Tax=Rosistilla oblonga TaxID=2527990 RepID=UPI003A96DB97